MNSARSNIINSFEGGMNLDSLPSLQPKNTYRYAYCAVDESDEEFGPFVTNELANELCVNIPAGSHVRGLHFVEERNQFVVLLLNGGSGEIGIIHQDTKEYEKIVTDDDIVSTNECHPDTLEIFYEEWADTEVKYLAPCNELYLYYSTNKRYKRVNLSEKCDIWVDIGLLECDCIPALETEIVGGNGVTGGLPNGVYSFFAQLVDTDGNVTNWFQISEPVEIGQGFDGDNKPAEPSGKSIKIKAKAASKEYGRVNFGVMSVVAGITTTEQFRTVTFGEGDTDVVYNGKTGQEIPIPLIDIITRKHGWLRGEGLEGYDGRLFLHTLEPSWNLDYQQQANFIRVGAEIWRVPARVAHKYKGLRRNGIYNFGIKWNYVDGTSSATFHIPGRAGFFDGDGNCPPKWFEEEDTDIELDIHQNTKGEVSLRKAGHGEPNIISRNNYAEPFDGDRFQTFYSSFTDIFTDAVHSSYFLDLEQGISICDQFWDTLSNACEVQYTCCDGGYMYAATCGGDAGANVSPSSKQECCGVDAEDNPIYVTNTGAVGEQLPLEFTFVGLNKPEIYNLATKCDRLTWTCPNDDLNCDPPCVYGDGSCRDEPFKNLVLDLMGRSDGATKTTAPTAKTAPDGTSNTAGTCVGGGCGGGSGGTSSATGGGVQIYDGNCSGPDCEGGYAGGGSEHTAIRYQPNTDGGDYIYLEEEKVHDYIDYEKLGPLKRIFNTRGRGGGIMDMFRRIFKRAEDGYNQHRKDMKVITFKSRGDRKFYAFPTAQRCEECERKERIGGNKKDDCPPQYRGSRTNIQKCIDGFWHTIYNAGTSAHRKPYQNTYKKVNFNARGMANLPDATGGTGGPDCEDGDERPELVKTFVSNGPSVFGTAVFEDTYPAADGDEPVLNCDCQPLWGVLEGQNLRFHRVPSAAKVPEFDSLSNGVPHSLGASDKEFDELNVYLIVPRFDGIPVPDNPPKPICRENPFSIMYTERTEYNKSVIGSGIMINTFEGQLYRDAGGGEGVGLFANHAVNSPEPYDVNIHRDGNFDRRGNGDNRTHYVFHSADLHLLKPQNTPTHFFHESEVWGTGWRYGLYDEGPDLENDFTNGREGQKGARQAVNLSKVNRLGEKSSHGIVGSAFLPANKILGKGDIFEYPFVNLHRESAQALRLDRALRPFTIPSGATDSDYGGVVVDGDFSNDWHDDSFLGDVELHESVIVNARANYGTMVRYVPRQYGSITGMNYIPFGMEGRANVDLPISDIQVFQIGGAEMGYPVGDSYVGPYSVKRSSFVSDKVGDEFLVERENFGEIKSGGFFGFIGGIFKGLANGLDIRTGGKLPVSGEDNLPNITGGLAGREGANPAFEYTDAYFPHVVKTNVYSVHSCDTNLYHRQTDNPDAGEVHIDRLKTLNRDSNFPYKSNWANGFLNRFFMRWTSTSKIKMIIYTILSFLWTYGIGLWILIKGLELIAPALGFPIPGPAGAPALIAGGLMSVFGGIWIAWFADGENIEDNNLIRNLLGIKLVTSDGTFDEEYVIDEQPPWYMNQGRVENFEDNYHRINPDYGTTNKYEVVPGMREDYVTCECTDEISTKVVYTNQQDPEAQIDAWKNVEVHNLLSVKSTNGPVMDMFTIGNKLYAHTTDQIVEIDTRRLAEQGVGIPPNEGIPIYGGIDEGYAGTEDPNASATSKWGHFFIDHVSRKIFRFTPGEGAKEISDAGVREFLKRHLPLRAIQGNPDVLRDQKINGGVGYSLGFDYKLNRLLVTKQDFDPETGCDLSWTLSYNIEKQQWKSFHPYKPYVYAWDRYNMFSFDPSEGKEDFYVHDNDEGKYQTFYGEHYPFIIENVVNDEKTYGPFKYESTTVDVEPFIWKEFDYVRANKFFFDKIMAWNAHQNTGESPFRMNEEAMTKLKGESNLLEREGTIFDRSKQDDSRVKVAYNLRRWRFSDLVDKLKDEEEHQFLEWCEVGSPKELNEGNIKSEGITNDHITDNFMVQRYTFDSRDDVKMILKMITNKVDYEER